jgi:hypothetical protein
MPNQRRLVKRKRLGYMAILGKVDSSISESADWKDCIGKNEPARSAGKEFHVIPYWRFGLVDRFTG